MAKKYSEDFEQIKEWYDSGNWSLKWVQNAVKKGRITAKEYKEITGDVYA